MLYHIITSHFRSYDVTLYDKTLRVILQYPILYCTMLCSNVLYCSTELYYGTLSHIILHYINFYYMLYYIALCFDYHVTLYYIMLHYHVLYSTLFISTILYSSILYYAL